MAYTDPDHTWALGEAASGFHTTLNTYLRDQLNALRSPDYMLKVFRTANLSLADSTATQVTWQSSAWNVGSMWSSVTNPTRFTAPVAGVYQLGVNMAFASNTTGHRIASWRPNGSGARWDLQNEDSGGLDVLSATDLILLAANDYIEVSVEQQSGGALNLLGGTEANSSATFRLLGLAASDPPAWSTPRSWTDGEPQGIIAPHDWNNDIRDRLLNLRYLKGIACAVYLSADVSVSSNSYDGIGWNTALFNLGGLWTGGAEFVAPVDGIYHISATLEWDEGSILSGQRGVGYRINKLNVHHDMQVEQGNPGAQNTSCNGNDLLQLAAGDVLEIYAFQATAESLSLKSNQDRTRATLRLVARL